MREPNFNMSWTLDDFCVVLSNSAQMEVGEERTSKKFKVFVVTYWSSTEFNSWWGITQPSSFPSFFASADVATISDKSWKVHLLSGLYTLTSKKHSYAIPSANLAPLHSPFLPLAFPAKSSVASVNQPLSSFILSLAIFVWKTSFITMVVDARTKILGGDHRMIRALQNSYEKAS